MDIPIDVDRKPAIDGANATDVDRKPAIDCVISFHSVAGTIRMAVITAFVHPSRTKWPYDGSRHSRRGHPRQSVGESKHF